VSVILVRYCEIGLKSTPVRRRFEAELKENMLTMLAADGVEAFVTYADARYYITAENVDACVASVKKVFGIASLSVAIECKSDMDEMCRTAAEYSIGKLSKGESFAVRARREGSQKYTSMDVGREVGSAIFIKNEALDPRVDLTHPDKQFFVEVRENKAYIFDRSIPCPGGLPMGSQGRVVAEVKDDRGLLSAWMMMKRGCRVLVSGDYRVDLLKKYDPTIRILEGTEDGGGYIHDVLGRVMGTDLDGLSAVDVTKYGVPFYFPTIGMSDNEVADMLRRIEAADFSKQNVLSSD
jgi:thiamine biosynthesis protein ThiI